LFQCQVIDIYIRNRIRPRTTLYADDSALTLTHKNVICLQTKLDCELQKINTWLKSNQLFLNVNKTNYLLFTKSKEKISLQINDSKIKQADSLKYLGVYLDDKLSWNRHIEHIETKLSAATGSLYKLRKYISHNAFNVRPGIFSLTICNYVLG